LYPNDKFKGKYRFTTRVEYLSSSAREHKHTFENLGTYNQKSTVAHVKHQHKLATTIHNTCLPASHQVSTNFKQAYT